MMKWFHVQVAPQPCWAYHAVGLMHNLGSKKEVPITAFGNYIAYPLARRILAISLPLIALAEVIYTPLHLLAQREFKSLSVIGYRLQHIIGLVILAVETLLLTPLSLAKPLWVYPAKFAAIAAKASKRQIAACATTEPTWEAPPHSHRESSPQALCKSSLTSVIATEPAASSQQKQPTDNFQKTQPAAPAPLQLAGKATTLNTSQTRSKIEQQTAQSAAFDLSEQLKEPCQEQKSEPADPAMKMLKPLSTVLVPRPTQRSAVQFVWEIPYYQIKNIFHNPYVHLQSSTIALLKAINDRGIINKPSPISISLLKHLRANGIALPGYERENSESIETVKIIFKSSEGHLQLKAAFEMAIAHDRVLAFMTKSYKANIRGALALQPVAARSSLARIEDLSQLIPRVSGLPRKLFAQQSCPTKLFPSLEAFRKLYRSLRAQPSASHTPLNTFQNRVQVSFS